MAVAPGGEVSKDTLSSASGVPLITITASVVLAEAGAADRAVSSTDCGKGRGGRPDGVPHPRHAASRGRRHEAPGFMAAGYDLRASG